MSDPTSTFKMLCDAIKPEHSEILKRMPYEDFLRSDYWQIVQKHILRLRPNCDRCRQPHDERAVYHRTHDRRGYEHLHLDDLIVLCPICYGKAHGQMVRGFKSVRQILNSQPFSKQ